MRVFLDAARRCRDLLALGRSAPARRRATMPDGCSPPSTSRPSRGARRHAAGLVDELSSRELDVLRLLRTELSGPDIARELIVSLNTVRTHTKNIYRSSA